MLRLFLVFTSLALCSALGSTILITSQGSSTDADEWNSANPDPNGVGNGLTIPIQPNSAWFGPLAGSTWVSYAQTGIAVNGGNPAYVVPDDHVVSFFQRFVLPEHLSYTGSITVLADDSAAVYLNGSPLAAEAPQSGNTYGRCSDQPIGCLESTQLAVTLPAELLHGGENLLRFDVAQRMRVSFGLNYAGEVVASPEPSTYLLIATGLIGLPLLRRKWRSNRHG